MELVGQTIIVFHLRSCLKNKNNNSRFDKIMAWFSFSFDLPSPI